MTAKTSSLSNKSGALLVAIGIFLSRIAGLLREKLFAYYLGQSLEGDVFRAALRIPNFLQNLLGEGVLSGSLIPPYTKLLAEGKKEESKALASAVFALLSLLVSGLVALGVFFAHHLVDFVAPGFEGAKRELCIGLVRILFPGVGLLVFSAFCLGILNSHKKFFLSYVSPVLWNFAIILALLWKGPSSSSELNLLVTYVTWGVVVGCALQFLVQVPSVLKLLGGIPFSMGFIRGKKIPGLGQVVKNFFPILTSRGVLQLSAFIDTMIASFLPHGALSIISYAQTLYLLPLSLFGMSISAAELPAMAELSAKGDLKSLLKARVESAVRRVAIFIVPTIFVFVFLCPYLLKILYSGGAFDTRTSWLVECTLWGSAIGLLASAQSRIFSSSFYALLDAKTPLRIAVVRVILSAGLGFGFSLWAPAYFGLENIYGTCGLTIAFGVGSWVEWFLLKKNLEEKIGSFHFRKGFLNKLILCAALPSILGLSLRILFPGLVHSYLWSILVLGLFGVLYFSLAYAFNITEIKELVDKKILTKLKKGQP